MSSSARKQHPIFIMCINVKNGREVTRTSHTSRLSPGSTRDLLIKKSWFWPLYSVFFMDFWGCEGSGATFHGLRMRSRSTRKCAHRNAGDLGSSLAVCACAYDPIHVTAQGKSLGPNCACVQPPRHYRGLPMNAYVLYPMGSREFSWPYMGISTSIGSHDLYARFWLVEKISAALWLVTDWCSPIHYFRATRAWMIDNSKQIERVG